MGNAKEDRSLWSHPHFGDPRVDPSARRRPGIFDLDSDIVKTEGSPVKPEIPTVPEKRTSRTLRFKRATVLYRSLFDGNGNPVLPQNFSQAEDFRREILQFEEDLEVSERSIGPGKRKSEIIKKLGTTAYGPFIEVVLHRKDGKGNEIEEKRFVSLLDRSLPRDNQRRRFKEQSR